MKVREEMENRVEKLEGLVEMFIEKREATFNQVGLLKACTTDIAKN